MMPDAQLHAYQQIVPWFQWEDGPVRRRIEWLVLDGLRHAVGDADIDWDTLDGPREIGRQWRVDTGEDDPDFPGQPLYVYLPEPPDEDPDAPPSLVLVRAEVTGRPRPKGPAVGTLSA